MRETKKSIKRRAEIFAAAKKLFETQGYEYTSVDQIVQEAGVAKGTFYYYFKSKEEALDAMMEEIDTLGAELIQPILDQQEVTAVQKLQAALGALRSYYAQNDKVLIEYHSLTDELIYYKSMVRSIKTLSIPFAQILEQGVTEGVFKTQDPISLAETVLTAGHFLLDSEIFPATKETYVARLQMVQFLLEKGLDMEPGCLDFLSDFRGLFFKDIPS